jgi:hypothetical protein
MNIARMAMPPEFDGHPAVSGSTTPTLKFDRLNVVAFAETTFAKALDVRYTSELWQHNPPVISAACRRMRDVSVAVPVRQ